MKRIVTRVKLHDLQIVVPGVGSLDKELPLRNKTLDMIMEEGITGIELTIKNVPGITVVPYANIQVYFTANESTTISETKAKK